MEEMVLIFVKSFVFLSGFFWGFIAGACGLAIINLCRKLFGLKPLALHIPIKDNELLNLVKSMQQDLKDLKNPHIEKESQLLQSISDKLKTLDDIKRNTQPPRELLPTERF